MRQAAQSRFIVNADRINHEEMPEWEAKPGSDFYFISADEPEAVAKNIVTVVKERIPRQFGMNRIR